MTTDGMNIRVLEIEENPSAPKTCGPRIFCGKLSTMLQQGAAGLIATSADHFALEVPPQDGMQTFLHIKYCPFCGTALHIIETGSPRGAHGKAKRPSLSVIKPGSVRE